MLHVFVYNKNYIAKYKYLVDNNKIFKRVPFSLFLSSRKTDKPTLHVRIILNSQNIIKDYDETQEIHKYGIKFWDRFLSLRFFESQ